jgi:hypothetical protein
MKRHKPEPEITAEDLPSITLDSPPSPISLSVPGIVSASEYDAIFAERKRRFNEMAHRRLHRGIVDPVVHNPPDRLKGKHAIGREPNAVLRKCVVLSDGHSRHRTVETIIGVPAARLLAKAYAHNSTRPNGVPPKG